MLDKTLTKNEYGLHCIALRLHHILTKLLSVKCKLSGVLAITGHVHVPCHFTRTSYTAVGLQSAGRRGVLCSSRCTVASDIHSTVHVAFLLLLFAAQPLAIALLRGVWFLWWVECLSPAIMSGFNLLHLITKSQPRALRSCSLPSGAHRTKNTWPLSFSQEELRKRLTPMQYHVTQERGTERAFTGEFTHHKDEGTYTCVVCGALLFSSNTKFDSSSGPQEDEP
ncbi:methionine-R-sulfoxide reductase B3 isoform X4 [Sparus aurata]|uniref:methionine-R-sulfoxide reductase B3 isoform X4 n=1 Tax=Sparus aurata TaxID=8175 RepID=UPI0011C0D7FC|nr:methionine-R-sulfoxide reductase B3 isoform X4 [Sparus aurata]